MSGGGGGDERRKARSDPTERRYHCLRAAWQPVALQGGQVD